MREHLFSKEKAMGKIKMVFLLMCAFFANGLARTAWPQVEHSGHQAPAKALQVETSGQSPQEMPPTIEIPQEKRQLIGVRTSEVTRKSLVRTIRTVGRIDYDERRLATVNTKFEGWIEKLYVDYSGRFVRKGELMAEIYSPELLATQQEFLNLLRWSEARIKEGGPWAESLGRDADAILQAARERLRLWDMTEGQIQELERTGKPIRTIKILSPASGYVLQKMAILGMRVMPGEKLFDLADLSTVWILADVYEYELPFVRVGTPARVSLSYLPETEFSSKIDYIYPTLSPETRTAKVRLSLPNPKGSLKPQMFGNVELKVDLGPRLLVPSEAVIDTGTRQIVYVDRGEGLFEPREVKLGIRTREMAEVVAGLRLGERVAASAAFLIDSEAQLKGVAPLGGHKN